MPEKPAPIVRGPEDGECIYAGGDLYRFLAIKDETNGSYGLWEAIVPPGGGPPPHLHRNEEEGFYLIEGRITVYAEGMEIEAVPGSFVYLPRGSKHWFRNNSDSNAKMLVLVAPGGMEGMFRETGSAVEDRNDPIPSFTDAEKQRILQVGSKYGIEIQKPIHE